MSTGKRLTGKKIVGFMSKGGRYAFSNEAFEIKDDGHLYFNLKDITTSESGEETTEIYSIDMGRVVGGPVNKVYSHVIELKTDDGFFRTLNLITTNSTPAVLSEETRGIKYAGHILASYYHETSDDSEESKTFEQASLTLVKNNEGSEVTEIRTNNYSFETGNTEITELEDTIEIIELAL